MPVINLLSPHVADMIAAGEVVERPASVIKELIENSFDAGAGNITVEIKDGGATCIRVTDDGCGMSPEDAGVAFLRHATSKLKDERGLEAIGTMGFRGEALAAISAVSRVELRTRLRGQAEGTRVALTAGDIDDMGSCGCPEGTSMTIRDLFYNTPARLKFLKSDRSEASACIQAALRCALGRPGVSVRFIRDGREEFFSPGDGRADSCIYTLLGREMSAAMLPCESREDGLSVTGFVSSPAGGRGNRSAQYFFCNGRYIKSTLLQSAVEQAYKNTLLTGRYPACVLYLELSCASVDVNVHPAKTEVRFSAEKRVFDLVYHAVLSALSAEREPTHASLGDGRAHSSVAYAAEQPVSIHSPAPGMRQSPGAGFSAPASASARSPGFRSPGVPFQMRMDFSKQHNSTSFDGEMPVFANFSADLNCKNVENHVQNVESKQVLDHKIVGEALKTYIIVERGEELVLIDKHAAHERMIFDRLKSQRGRIMPQSLLTPVTLRLSPEQAEAVDANGEIISSLGFEVEPFGREEYIIRALPADLDSTDAAAALEELCEKLLRGSAPDAASASDELLHTVACKAAIKAGWDNDPRELEVLVEAVLSGRVKYCPHGRPVSVVLTRRELDKQFKRIV